MIVDCSLTVSQKSVSELENWPAQNLDSTNKKSRTKTPFDKISFRLKLNVDFGTFFIQKGTD